VYLKKGTNRTLRRLDIQYLGDEKSDIDYSPLNLPKKTILEIRRLCEEKKLNYTQIGNKFKISNTTVGRIANKKGAYSEK
jgi:DNA invertase Pin-like site-specific DNA recombinase